MCESPARAGTWRGAASARSSWSSCCSCSRTTSSQAPLGIMVQGLIVLTLASMWNLLAGYAGLVSVGQQAFFGLGAYFVLIPAMHGVTPWFGLVIAAIGAGVCALPLWWLVARLRLGYFAIATWVLASVVMLVIEQIQLHRRRHRRAAARPVRHAAGGAHRLHLLGRADRRGARHRRGLPAAALQGRPGAHRDPRRRAGRAVLRRAGRPGPAARLRRRRRRVRRGGRRARHRAAPGGARHLRRRVLACSGRPRWRSR